MCDPTGKRANRLHSLRAEKLFLDSLFRCDVAADRDILVWFSFSVKEGNYGRINPVVRAVFGSVLYFTTPDLAAGDRGP